MENGLVKLESFKEIGSRLLPYAKTSLYANINKKCFNKCTHCRNRKLDLPEPDEAAILESISRIYPHMATTYLGGGEPLLSQKLLRRVLNFPSNLLTVTSAPRDLLSDYLQRTGFFDKARFSKYATNPRTGELEKLGKLDILVSRHKLCDKANNEFFGNEMMSFDGLDYLKKENILQGVLATINKAGGMSTADEIVEYTCAFTEKDIPVFFNTLQKEVGDENFYQENKVDDSEIERAKVKLCKLGFKKYKTRVSSGGYTVESFYNNSQDYHTKVAFQKYHENINETMEAWQRADYVNYDFSMMPDGTIYFDERFATGKGKKADPKTLPKAKPVETRAFMWKVGL